MSQVAQLTQLRSQVVELRHELDAKTKQLSSKTKQCTQYESMISSLKLEIIQKNQKIDDLQITSKMSQDTVTDEMYLEIEGYKNEISSQQSEYEQLQRQYQINKSQFDALQRKHSQSENTHNLRLSRLESTYKQKIDSILKMHSNQISNYEQEIEKLKDAEIASSNEQTQSIKMHINELKESHDRIEADLNSQIEDLKEQMIKREKEKQNLISELHALSDKHKEFAQNEIQQLTDKLRRFEEGDVEIILKIELEDPILSKPPPKKQAPTLPKNQSLHSRHSSNASSNASYRKMSLSPQLLNGHNQSMILNSNKPTLSDSKSNPEIYQKSEKTQTPKLVHRSMPNSDHESERADDDDEEDEIIDLSESQSENENEENEENDDTLYPVSTENVSNYPSPRRNVQIKRKKRRRSFMSALYGLNTNTQSSKSANALPNTQSNDHSNSQSPSFYIFRRNHKQQNIDNDDDEKHTQGYNVKDHTQKYSDSTLGMLKNGVVSMWGGGGSPRHRSQTSTTPRSTNGIHKNSASVGNGFPNTPTFLGSNVSKKRTFSNVSFESMGDLFSDTLSVASGGSFGDDLSSIQNVGADDLKNKTLDMQRKMLMQANTRLAEDLKNEKKNVMIIKEKAHRKYKQLQVAMHAEMKQLHVNMKAMNQRLQKKQNQSKQSEFVIADLQKKYNALKQEYGMRIGQNGMNVNNENYAALDANNKSLIQQCEKYRRELGTLKQTILSCNDTMQQQQKQILVLNQQLSEQRKLNGFGGGQSSSEQLLQKQIRLLKSQRRMLIQELKDLREQNDKLKNMIVTGQNLIDK